MRTVTVLAALSFLLLFAACGGDEATPEAPTAPMTPPDAPATPPDHVTVDHILIAVKNPRIPDGKTPEEARTLAYDLMKQLEAGADWAALKSKHSADPPPGGPYSMANDGVAPQAGEFPRGGMAKAFGDVGFALQVGETGMADFDAATSPFGFHIIKRIK